MLEALNVIDVNKNILNPNITLGSRRHFKYGEKKVRRYVVERTRLFPASFPHLIKPYQEPKHMSALYGENLLFLMIVKKRVSVKSLFFI